MTSIRGGGSATKGAPNSMDSWNASVAALWHTKVVSLSKLESSNARTNHETAWTAVTNVEIHVVLRSEETGGSYLESHALSRSSRLVWSTLRLTKRGRWGSKRWDDDWTHGCLTHTWPQWPRQGRATVQQLTCRMCRSNFIFFSFILLCSLWASTTFKGIVLGRSSEVFRSLTTSDKSGMSLPFHHCAL